MEYLPIQEKKKQKTVCVTGQILHFSEVAGWRGGDCVAAMRRTGQSHRPYQEHLPGATWRTSLSDPTLSSCSDKENVNVRKAKSHIRQWFRFSYQSCPTNS